MDKLDMPSAESNIGLTITPPYLSNHPLLKGTDPKAISGRKYTRKTSWIIRVRYKQHNADFKICLDEKQFIEEGSSFMYDNF